ncbi:Uncharacterized protein TCM_033272 [Theobroma cacao]|uniref:Retrotransposon gag domain-containing protein n=1 Tax=Theobroma cacao TaxID=3641 RepID=A0A061FBG7_THECC|nr:Uncharacterized protein TCM_033272 [Theobroma cacao]
MLDVRHSSISELRSQLEECNALFGGGPLAMQPASKVDIPKPKEFKGQWSAQDINNFLWGMEQYFRATNIVHDGKKINTALMYLTDLVCLWWRRKCDERHGEPTISTCADFVHELKV